MPGPGLIPHTVEWKGHRLSGFLVRNPANYKELGYIWQAGSSWRWRTLSGEHYGERATQKKAVEVVIDAERLRRQPGLYDKAPSLPARDPVAAKKKWSKQTIPEVGAAGGRQEKNITPGHDDPTTWGSGKKAAWAKKARQSGYDGPAPWATTGEMGWNPHREPLRSPTVAERDRARPTLQGSSRPDGRRVLITPPPVQHVNWTDEEVDVVQLREDLAKGLTKSAVRHKS